MKQDANFLILNFNPRSREGSDNTTQSSDVAFSISIHAPAKGATLTKFHISLFIVFQSTLPRRERRYYGICYFCQLPISIHAPAKGATQKGHKSRRDLFISIHAPAKGATVFATSGQSQNLFQSTLPRRERHLKHILTLR